MAMIPLWTLLEHAADYNYCVDEDNGEPRRDCKWQKLREARPTLATSDVHLEDARKKPRPIRLSGSNGGHHTCFSRPP